MVQDGMALCGVARFSSIFFVQASVAQMLQPATALPISKAQQARHVVLHCEGLCRVQESSTGSCVVLE